MVQFKCMRNSILHVQEKLKFQLFATEFDDNSEKLDPERLQHHLKPQNHTQRSLDGVEFLAKSLKGRWSLLQTCHTT